MQINDAGIALLREFEGMRLTAYRDSAGKWTIGIGHLILPDESDLMDGITEADAESLLRNDLASTTRGVERLTDVALTDNQASALICFAFNEGVGAYEGSTLRRLVNQGSPDAADEFGKWVYVTEDGEKVESAGLIRRRAAERDLFLA